MYHVCSRNANFVDAYIEKSSFLKQKQCHLSSYSHYFCIFYTNMLFFRNKMDENDPEIVWKKRVEIELKKLTEEPKTKTDLLRK